MLTISRRWVENNFSFLARLTFLLLAIALVAIYTFVPPLFDTHISGDGWDYYAMTRSLFFDRDLNLANEFSNCCNQFPHSPHPATGVVWSVAPIGTALLWLPTLALTHVGLVAASLFTDVGATDGFSRPYFIGTTFGSVILFWIAALLLYQQLKRDFSDKLALGSTFLFIFGSNALLYGTLHTSYTHAASLAANAAAITYWRATLGDFRVRRWIGLGALCGLCALVRQQAIVVALVPFIEWVRYVLRQRPTPWKTALATGFAATSTACMVFFPQLLTWKYHTGSWVLVPQGDSFVAWSDFSIANTLNILFWTRNGLIPWNPVYGLGLFGFFATKFFRKEIFWPFLFWLAGALYVNAVVTDLWNGWSYGHRRFIDLAPLFVFGIALFSKKSLDWCERHKDQLVIAPLLAVGGLIILLNIFTIQNVWERKTKVALATPMNEVYSKSFQSFLNTTWNLLGNPLSLPASLYYRFFFELPLRSFDRVLGDYLLYRFEPTEQPLEDRLRPTDVRSRFFLVKGTSDNTRFLPIDNELRWALPIWRIHTPVVVTLRFATTCDEIPTARWEGTDLTFSSSQSEPCVLQASVPAERVQWGLNKLHLRLGSTSMELIELHLATNTALK